MSRVLHTCKDNDRAALSSNKNKISLLQFHFVICSVSISKYMIGKLGCEDHWYPKSLQQRAKVNEYLDWQQSNIMPWCAMVFLQDVSVNKNFALFCFFFSFLLLMSGTLIFHISLSYLSFYIYDDINHTPRYQVKIHHFIQFILFFGAVFGFKKCKISL